MLMISVHTGKGENDMELISRNEAIVMLEDMEGRRDEDGYIRIYKCDAIDNLRSLPAVEERKEGRWVRITQDVGLKPHQYMCTECHRIIEYNSAESPSLLEIRYPYCHCGAKMRGEVNEADYG